ncbi:MAG: hypothetical protein AAF388_24805 [Bacteroidota bacterium]
MQLERNIYGQSVLILLIGLISLSFLSCNKNVPVEQEVVATYKGEKLYREEVNQYLPFQIVSDTARIEDSTRLADKYVQRWIKDRLMADQARSQIQDLDEKIQYQLDNYKYQLIQQEYINQVLRQQLNTNVSDSEVENYYQQNQDKFKSKAPYYSFFHIRTPVLNPYQQVAWMRSAESSDINRLKEWAEGEGESVMIKLDSTFLPNQEIILAGEGFFGDITRIRKKTVYNYFTNQDEKYYNFIKVLDVIEAGEVKPLSLCRNEIVQRILSKRKNRLIEQTESDLWQKAQKNKGFRIAGK